MKFVFTGPECSGKTTMTNWAYGSWGGNLVLEEARAYLEKKNGVYDYEDLLKIAQNQNERHESTINENGLSWFDTDALTLYIWSVEKFGKADSEILNIWLQNDIKHFFLCSPDMPWVEDQLRENPHDRDRLFEIYLEELKKYSKPFTILKGDMLIRQKTVKETILNL